MNCHKCGYLYDDALGRYGCPNCPSPVARAIDQMERGLASEAGRVAVNAETQAARDCWAAERAFGKPGVTI
jgi:hypothetical protein